MRKKKSSKNFFLFSLPGDIFFSSSQLPNIRKAIAAAAIVLLVRYDSLIEVVSTTRERNRWKIEIGEKCRNGIITRYT